MKIGFIGLGNVGAKLAGSLLRNRFDLTIRDLDEKIVRSFVDKGAACAASPKQTKPEQCVGRRPRVQGSRPVGELGTEARAAELLHGRGSECVSGFIGQNHY